MTNRLRFPPAGNADATADFELLPGLIELPETVLAVVLRVHLVSLLRGLLVRRVRTREEVLDFIRELERETLTYEERLRTPPDDR